MNKNNRNRNDKSCNFSLSTQGKANMMMNNSTALTAVQHNSQVCHLPHHPRYLTLVMSSSQCSQYHNTRIWYKHSSTTDLHFSVSNVPIPKNPLTWLFIYIHTYQLYYRITVHRTYLLQTSFHQTIFYTSF